MSVRTQRWRQHFALAGALIQPLTPEGRVTVKILGLNNEQRLAERAMLVKAGAMD